MHRTKKSDGFAMIEVLLAIVILAIGLLAGSRMQILGLNYTQGATTRSYATMAANDILDRMRINPGGIDTYDGFDTTGAIPADQQCTVNICDATQRANQDLRTWARYFRKGDATTASTLLPPDASGTIELDAAGLMTMVTISWTELIRGEEEDQSVAIGAVL